MHDSLPDLLGVRSAGAAGAARDRARAASTAIATAASSRRTIWRWRCARCSPARPRAPADAAARPRGKSLAVLPFVNAGADPQIEYLTDGITESIINSLSQLTGLRVVPRSLVFRYKGLQADPATVGLALNARTILTGRVVQQGRRAQHPGRARRHGHRVAALGGTLPAETRAICMMVQEEIAWQISEALRLKLTGEQKKKLRKRPTVNPEAYQEYLRGRYHWNNWSAGQLPPRARALRAGDRARPGLRAGVCGPRRCLRRDVVLRVRRPGRRLPARPRGRAAGHRARPGAGRRARDARHRAAVLGLGLGRRGAGAPDGDPDSNPKLALAHARLWTPALDERPVRRGDARRHGSRASSIRCRSSSTWASPGCTTSPAVTEEAVREALKAREIAAGPRGGRQRADRLVRSARPVEDAAQLIRQQRCWGMAFDGAALAAALPCRRGAGLLAEAARVAGAGGARRPRR